ncbi:ORF376 [White spot syndrome virus]|uniref:Wsv347 n=3 Tax=White spot syndrome virus TaxID=342409 RepID=Q8VAQ4_WSSVS|nr:wsv347 [Shrimp white spot syndrome virus]AFX59724.1 wsv347 [White spot syndrome virus]AAL33349.1 wsv347 [Shrimp white spot syndrome virus]AAL89271.1 WSSV403 [Shrimp white spot syndrome virus]ATU84017.1 ORF376 [White spot syndrome virus]AWQ60476.1 wsv347 [Shrimp white spot syndrome virus]
MFIKSRSLSTNSFAASGSFIMDDNLREIVLMLRILSILIFDRVGPRRAFSAASSTATKCCFLGGGSKTG